MVKRVSPWTALAALVPILAALPAVAHGPTRQKVIETIEINAPVDKVWAVIGNFQDMSWHPAVEKTEGTGGSEAGATRTLTLKSGGTIKEMMDKYEPDKKSFKYEITEVDVKVLPVTTYESWVTLTPAGDKTSVEWRGKFYRGDPNNDPKPGLDDDTAVAAITGIYKSGLEALKKKLEGG